MSGRDGDGRDGDGGRRKRERSTSPEGYQRRSAVEVQRLKLERLMAHPEKEVHIPEAKTLKLPKLREFDFNVHGLVLPLHSFLSLLSFLSFFSFFSFFSFLSTFKLLISFLFGTLQAPVLVQDLVSSMCIVPSGAESSPGRRSSWKCQSRSVTFFSFPFFLFLSFFFFFFFAQTL